MNNICSWESWQEEVHSILQYLRTSSSLLQILQPGLGQFSCIKRCCFIGPVIEIELLNTDGTLGSGSRMRRNTCRRQYRIIQDTITASISLLLDFHQKVGICTSLFRMFWINSRQSTWIGTTWCISVFWREAWRRQTTRRSSQTCYHF